jgi:hypothetical protein
MINPLIPPVTDLSRASREDEEEIMLADRGMIGVYSSTKADDGRNMQLKLNRSQALRSLSAICRDTRLTSCTDQICISRMLS